MDAELREMLDHHQIRKVLAEYCRGVDRADETHVASIYARESWDDHGLVKASGEEFARIMCSMVAQTTETLSHLLGQSLITITGDEAGAETYFLAVARDTAPDGTGMCNQLGGRFVDRLVREEGKWKVRHRIVMRDWSAAIPLTHDWETSKTLRPGERSQGDPSYDVLGTRYGAPAD